jgi:hypothetical protein
VRISHHPELRLLCVGCQRSQPHRVGESPLESSSFKFIDDTTFERMLYFVSFPFCGTAITYDPQNYTTSLVKMMKRPQRLGRSPLVLAERKFQKRDYLLLLALNIIAADSLKLMKVELSFLSLGLKLSPAELAPAKMLVEKARLASPALLKSRVASLLWLRWPGD